MKHPVSLTRWASALVLGAVIVGACSTSTSNPSTAYIAGGTITLRNTGDWTCLDPGTCLGGWTALSSNVYATLLSLDSSGTKIVPYLAASWTTTPSSITFTLRKDVTCSDGTPVTATIVRNSLQRLIDIKAPRNATRWGPGPYSVSADNAAGAVTFTTGGPYSDLAFGFVDAQPANGTGIVCPAGLANPKLLSNGPQTFGAGPYTIVEAVHGDHITMKLRPEFSWGPEGFTAKTVGVPQTVVFKVIENETTAVNLLLAGGMDVAQVSGPDGQRMLSDKSLTSRQSSWFQLIFVAFNQTQGRPGADKTVRQALITAIDPKAFRAVAFSGVGGLSSSIVTSDVPCYDPATTKLAPMPSVDAARKVLLDAGWTMSNGKLTKDGKTLKVVFDAGPAVTGLGGVGAEYIVSQWAQMGVDARLDLKDLNGWSTDAITSNFDVTSLVAGGVLPLLSGFAGAINGPTYPQGSNYARINNPVVNRELPLALASTGAESCRHWYAVQEALWTNWDLLPLSGFPFIESSRTFDISHTEPPSMGWGQVLRLRRVKSS